jgi:hypothetical protein
VLEKLRRTLVPLFSGGLPVNKISELNQFIERELLHLQKGAERPFNMELSVLLPSVNFFRTQSKSQEEVIHELY